MASLNPDAEELLEAGRAVLRADGADMDRVEAALLARLGPSAFSAAGTPTPVAGKAVLLTLAATAALVVGGAALMLGEDEKPLARRAPAPLQQTAPSPAPAPPPEVISAAPAPEAVTPPLPRRSGPSRVAASNTASSNTLAEEVALLSRASNAFRGGRPADALLTLAEHQRRFPNGTLAQERSAARVQALCTLGRRSEGLTELERLSRRWPGSPLEARAQRACGITSGGTKK